jgi:hypothetical protein
MDKYNQFLETKRYSNLLLEKWMKSQENFLEKICKKEFKL